MSIWFVLGDALYTYILGNLFEIILSLCDLITYCLFVSYSCEIKGGGYSIATCKFLN